jgi:hypothetical protein
VCRIDRSNSVGGADLGRSWRMGRMSFPGFGHEFEGDVGRAQVKVSGVLGAI